MVIIKKNMLICKQHNIFVINIMSLIENENIIVCSYLACNQI